jgi:integrase
MALTNKNVVFAKPGRHHGGVTGLYLWVSPDKQIRRWIFRYTSPVSRKVTEHGLGLIQFLSLAEAKSRALDLQRQVQSGVCPIAEKRAAKFALATTQTFGECAEAWLETHRSAWRSTSQLKNAKTLLFKHGKPLQVVPVSQITPNSIQVVLAGLWNKHPNQARRVLSMFERVLDFAKARGAREGDNPCRWKGNMEYRFPKKCSTSGAHYSALSYVELPGFLTKLRARQSHSVGATALEFLILTATRTGEVLGMQWDEVDFEQRVWTLSADRTKQNRPHQVPLCNRAMAILRARHERSAKWSSPYVFLGYNRTQLSSKSMAYILRAMGLDVTVHGFRSTFSTWTGEETNFDR